MDVYESNERYMLTFEEGENVEDGERYVFLHLDVYQWNKSVCKELKLLLDEVLLLAKNAGYNMVSFYMPATMSTKFHSMLRPLDYEKTFGPSNEYIVAGWFTSEV